MQFPYSPKPGGGGNKVLCMYSYLQEVLSPSKKGYSFNNNLNTNERAIICREKSCKNIWA